MQKFLNKNKPLITFEILNDEFFLYNNKRTSDIILKLEDLGFNFFYEVKDKKYNEIDLIRNFKNKQYRMVLASKDDLNI